MMKCITAVESFTRANRSLLAMFDGHHGAESASWGQALRSGQCAPGPSATEDHDAPEAALFRRMYRTDFGPRSLAVTAEHLRAVHAERSQEDSA